MMKTDNKEFLLYEYKEKGPLTMDGLIACLKGLIPLFVPRQVRYKVNKVPDKRTVRYYITKGLIDKPRYSGRLAYFSYRHILQLLAVKFLQAQNFTLTKIAETTRNNADFDLEQILLGKMAQKGAGLPVVQPKRSISGWRRFRIDEKLELHMEDGFDVSRLENGLDGVSQEIRYILKTFGQKSGPKPVRPQSEPTQWPKPVALDLLEPAVPLVDLSSAVIALITEGGLVPKGNPDRLPQHHSDRYLKYTIKGLKDFKEGEFESVDSGWDRTFVNKDPDRLLPLDVMREIESEKRIAKVHEYFYTTSGVATPIETCSDMGRHIAADLINAGVSAAILTAT